MTMEGGGVPIPERLVPALQLIPLLVRNSIDHGIEPGDHRAPKPAVATVAVRACELPDGELEIELSDDGQGISSENVGRRAVALGALTSDALARMTEAERLALIFLPGLSTAKRVSESSGRGVGLDAVKAAVESLRGRVDVQSRPGLGTSFVLRFAA